VQPGPAAPGARTGFRELLARRRRARRKGEPRPRLSDALRELADAPSPVLTLGEAFDAVGERSFGALIVVLALVNLVAGVIPGVSTVLGVPLVLLSLQLVAGRPRPWLPRRLRTIRLQRSALRRKIERFGPALGRLERALRPRLHVLTGPWAERIIGVVCLGLSVFLCLPVPFGNLLPSITLALFGFALLERDGLVALLAVGVAAADVVLFGGMAVALFKAAAAFGS
jgi:hypothetical protein